MSIIGDIGDPVKDVAALKPLVDEAIAKIGPALEAALMGAFDGLTITITVTKKTD